MGTIDVWRGVAIRPRPRRDWGLLVALAGSAVQRGTADWLGSNAMGGVHGNGIGCLAGWHQVQWRAGARVDNDACRWTESGCGRWGRATLQARKPTADFRFPPALFVCSRPGSGRRLRRFGSGARVGPRCLRINVRQAHQPQWGPPILQLGDRR